MLKKETPLDQSKKRQSDYLADSHTPLIYNTWYVAATSDEVGDALMSRRLLEQSVLLYRTSDGRVAALDNRCPHRSFPLAEGRRIGDNVACGYHGMTFGPDGRCVHMPTISKTPANLVTRTYPVVERLPLIWIWLGDPTLADESMIPPHRPLVEDGWAMVSGYYNVKANYVGLQENLQDLSHFEHLHSSSIGVPSQNVGDVIVEKRAEGIFSTRVYANVPAPPMWKKVLNLAGDKITRTIAVSFCSPALNEALTTITDEGKDEAEHRDHYLRIIHFITPEFQDTTHYFWFFMRDFAVDGPEIGQKVYDGIGAAFMEDKDALERIAEMTRLDSRSDFRELSFLSDKPGVMLRRELSRLAGTERDLGKTRVGNKLEASSIMTD